VLDQADHVSVSATTEAVIGLRVFIEFQAGSFLIVFVEAFGLTVLIHSNAVLRGDLKNIQCVLQLFDIA
jgi:hypothetical protein